MDEEENPRGDARGEVGNSTLDGDGVDADADADTNTDDTPNNDASGGDGSADSLAAEDNVSPEDIDIQTSIGPDADAPDAPDEDLDQYKDPDVGLDEAVLNDDEGSEGLFDDLLAGGLIFESKEVLCPSCTPHELPHRTDQINQMAAILVSALCGETPSSTLIHGKTGTGKTMSAKFVSQEFESTSQRYDVPHEVEYINHKVMDTQYRALAQLVNKFIEKDVRRTEAEQERLDETRMRATEDPNVLEETSYDPIAEVDEYAAGLDDGVGEMETVPVIGWPTDRVYTTSFDAVDYRERVVVIVLDEIGKLVEKSDDDTLYNLSQMNPELDNSRISTMGASNDLKFTGFLDPRVKSGLGEEEIVFPPYNANQPRDILQHHADVAFKLGVPIDDVIPLRAMFVTQEHSDARCTLDLLRTADELAEREQADTVEEAHVQQAQDRIKLDRMAEVVRILPTQSEIILFATILLEKNGVRNISTSEAFNIYKCLCEEIDTDVLTQRCVTDLISGLDMLGIVNAAVVSKGRYGQAEKISLSVPIDETEAVLLTNSRLGDTENAQPFAQVRFDN